MNLKSFLGKLDFAPSKEELNYLKDETRKLIAVLQKEIARQKIGAELFAGGSFAKGTLVKSHHYDVDIFVRFDWKYDSLSDLLGKIVSGITKEANYGARVIHGSRDYFRLFKDDKIRFELIPVTKIKHPKEERNVTDLSYFHVNYVKKKLKENLVREVLIAKKFCAAQGVYGAESYINGFSGYGLECLIIYYKSFEKMIRELLKVKLGERLIIDPEKKYKNKSDVLFGLNEAKLQSPVIVIDPTWRERNALAALSRDSFLKFQDALRKFIGNPRADYFEISKLDVNAMKKTAVRKKAEFLHLKLTTDRQEGDIAGTKLKKFSKFLSSEISRYFKILGSEFVYDDSREADFFMTLKSRGEVMKIGPPVSLKKNTAAFRKANENWKVGEKNGNLYAVKKVDFSGAEFLENWIRANKEKMKAMGVVELKIQGNG